MVLWLGGVYYYPPSEAYFCQFIKLILCPVLLPCWRGVVIFWKRKGILVFGIVSLFALVFPHLHGFIYLWSSMLVTFKWGFCVEVLFVDIDAIHFCLLVLLLTVRPLCCRSAGICWRSTPDPVCLDITSRGCRTTKIAACSFLWKLCPRGAPTRRQLELSCSLCYGSSSVETTGNKIQVYDSFISKHVRIIYKEPRIVAGFELLASRDPPASAPLSVGITGMSHRPWPRNVKKKKKKKSFTVRRKTKGIWIYTRNEEYWKGENSKA
nr:lysophosphatidic acid receptor 6 isoform X2 [Pan troglodytes]